MRNKMIASILAVVLFMSNSGIMAGAGGRESVSVYDGGYKLVWDGNDIIGVMEHNETILTLAI